MPTGDATIRELFQAWSGGMDTGDNDRTEFDPVIAAASYGDFNLDDGLLPGQSNVRAAAAGPSTAAAGASLIEPSCLGSLWGGSNATFGAKATETPSHRSFSDSRACEQ